MQEAAEEALASKREAMMPSFLGKLVDSWEVTDRSTWQVPRWNPWLAVAQHLAAELHWQQKALS